VVKFSLEPPAKKFIKKIKDKQLFKKFQEAFNEIIKDYTVGKIKKGDLTGIYGYDVFYNKTNYEIAYSVEIDEDENIIIIMIGTRENFYKELKNYLN